MPRLTDEQVKRWTELFVYNTESWDFSSSTDGVTLVPAEVLAAAREALPVLLAERAELLAALQRLSKSFGQSEQFWAEIHDKNLSLTACARSISYGKCATQLDKLRRGEYDALVD